MSAEQSRPAHSPLGASSAERWMNCPGSIALLKALTLPETDEPDWTREGIAMHEAAAHCLEQKLDTWEITGQTFHDTVVDEEMAQQIQVYLDTVRNASRDALSTYIEFPISSPVHPDFYGTLDFGALFVDRVEITDLKGGMGIIVEPEGNPQFSYYAWGLIEPLEQQRGSQLPDEFPVVLRVVQPRAFHILGAVREWRTTVGALRAWVHDTLVPAMYNAEIDGSLDAGPWCRFCPAKLVCPLLTSLFRAAATYNPREIVNMNDESLGRSYQYRQAVQFYLKAQDEETYRRLNAGRMVPGTKLVPKKANRVWTSDAEKEAKAKFGEDAFTKPAMKSPAELERLDPKAKEFVHEHSYTPNTGLTVALEHDPRPAVKVQSTEEAFGAAIKGLEK